MTRSGWFLAGSGFHLLAWIGHSLDHVRRGLLDLERGVQALGVLQVLLTLGFVWLLVKRHVLGPIAAVGIGALVTVVIAIAHLAPDFGVLSDSLWAPGIDTFTWVAAITELAGAVALTAVGWRAVRAGEYPQLLDGLRSRGRFGAW